MAHVARLRLRESDLREVEALGLNKMSALRSSLERSLWADAYLANGPNGPEVAAIAGCCMTSMVGGVAVPWLLTGPAVEWHKRAFLTLTRQRVREMQARHGM